MRSLVLFAAFLVIAGPAVAQDPPSSPKGATLGEDAPGHERCVEVEIGSAKAYDCLNTRLKQQVDRVTPLPHIPPTDAKSPDIELGIVNMPGVRQQYGKNFGVSVFPYRPAPGGR